MRANLTARPASLPLCACVASAALLVAGVRAESAIRPHRAIGPISLGMTLAEVERALGRPMLVNRRVPLGFRGEYVEYLWDYGVWIVGVQRSGGRYRVVRVSTTARRHRTAHDLGVGSRVAEVVRRYPSATCRDLFPLGRWISVRGPDGRRTIFVTRSDRKATSHPQPVSEVIVQESVPAYGVRLTFRCEPGWRRH